MFETVKNDEKLADACQRLKRQFTMEQCLNLLLYIRFYELLLLSYTHSKWIIQDINIRKKYFAIII